MRVIAAVLLTVVILLLCIYSGFHPPETSLDDCLSAPRRYDGRVIYSPREARIGEVYGDGFLLRWGGNSIPVKGEVHGAVKGRYVQVKGIFHREGYIEAVRMKTGTYRRLKMAVSVVAVAIVFFVLKKEMCWDREDGAFTVRR